jgi:hypothetical protein
MLLANGKIRRSKLANGRIRRSRLVQQLRANSGRLTNW